MTVAKASTKVVVNEGPAGHLPTFNGPDFQRYPGIAVLDPAQVAKGAKVQG